MTRRELSLLGVIILVASLIFVFYLSRRDGLFVVGAPPPQPSPTPCFLRGVGSSPPAHICLTGCGSRFNDIAQSENNAQDVLCCPKGTTFGKTTDGKDTCVISH